MADADTPTPETPAAEPAKTEETKPETKPELKLDPSKSMTSQVDGLLKNLPEDKKEEDVKSEDTSPEETPEAAKKEDEAPENKDDGVEPEAEAEPELTIPEPDAESDVEPVELPAPAKYILDNLPTIQTVGHEGEGKDKLFTVKRIEDLPKDFEFADRRTELTFNAAIAAQELNARELLAKYKQQESSNQYNEFKNQEALDIQSDVKALQKEGVLPKFEYDIDDPKYNSDPAVKEANAIYALYEKTNQDYFNKYKDSGRTYRISYRDAADKYYALKGRTKPAEVSKNKVEREEVAAKSDKPQGTPKGEDKRTMPPGSSMRDVMRLYNQGRI